MKKFLLGFLTAFFLVYLSAEYGQYRLWAHKSYNSETDELAEVYIPKFLPVHKFIRLGYFSLIISGHCSNKPLKKYPDTTEADYFECDWFQRLINRKN